MLSKPRGPNINPPACRLSQIRKGFHFGQEPREHEIAKHKGAMLAGASFVAAGAVHRICHKDIR